jgi:hypothetical protein
MLTLIPHPLSALLCSARTKRSRSWTTAAMEPIGGEYFGSLVRVFS